MKVLVTGSTGFVASHLIRELESNNHNVILTAPSVTSLMLDDRRYEVLSCDLTDLQAVSKMIKDAAPEAIIHLGGISNVPLADKARIELSSVNVVGTHNLCAAATQLAEVTFILASSALVYGSRKVPKECDELTLPEPDNPYAMSKLAAEYVVQSFQSEHFRSYCVRPFNHIGPGQSRNFVCSALAKRIVDAKDGDVIIVGNLDAKRDFSDVRDIARAYRRIMELKPSENLFVLGSGEVTSIQSILEFFIKLSDKQLTTRVEPGLLRVNDEQVKVARSSRARDILGWRPELSIEKSLSDIYESCLRC